MAGPAWELQGRVALITGAARGIGAEAARRLAGAGMRVSLVGLEPGNLERVANEIGPAATWIEADVTDRSALEAAVAATVERLGGIDVVIANAGVAAVGTVETIDPATFERTIEVNLLGVWRTVRAALPHVIERRGYVLPIASLAAALHSPLIAPYTAAKAGVEAFADALRAEMVPAGVDVGVAYFSFIDTDMVRGAREHPALRDAGRSPADRPAALADAGVAILTGVRRRSRWVVVPRWVAPVLVARGAVQPLADLAQRRSRRLREALRRANEEARR